MADYTTELTATYKKAPAPTDDKALYRYLDQELRKIEIVLAQLKALLEEVVAAYPHP
jgi:hypothetical protein